MSGRAAAQLELMGYRRVLHYFRGKADWIVRGLPSEPRATAAERMRALPFFINNLAPQIRAAWIRYSRRHAVGEWVRDDLVHLKPSDPAPPATLGRQVSAVVLNGDGVVLGAIESAAAAAGASDGEASARPAIKCMNPAPQTIRPDMTRALAATLLRKNAYLLVTLARGQYAGRYAPGER
jgi:hypothetical protein